jgi:hypothetical protein
MIYNIVLDIIAVIYIFFIYMLPPICISMALVYSLKNKKLIKDCIYLIINQISIIYIVILQSIIADELNRSINLFSLWYVLILTGVSYIGLFRIWYIMKKNRYKL